MSTKYFTATCNQLSKNEFLVESSEGGKLQFRIEMKDGEKTGVFGDFEPKGRLTQQILFQKAFPSCSKKM
jgi:antitoxin component YwqK of YwqJK toxin-antitoxin module